MSTSASEQTDIDVIRATMLLVLNPAEDPDAFDADPAVFYGWTNTVDSLAAAPRDRYPTLRLTMLSLQRTLDYMQSTDREMTGYLIDEMLAEAVERTGRADSPDEVTERLEILKLMRKGYANVQRLTRGRENNRVAEDIARELSALRDPSAFSDEVGAVLGVWGLLMQRLLAKDVEWPFQWTLGLMESYLKEKGLTLDDVM